ncbi:MAG: hypothetical protein IPP38_12470 [Bacteroidetes bacterium]|nr:hypothetical protein [Bacteroidota bacterium]
MKAKYDHHTLIIDTKKIDTYENGFIQQWEKEDDVYLTFEQLKKIRALKFKKDQKKLELYRDMFLLGCNSACSIIDLKNIKELYHSKSEGWYVQYTRQKKTKAEF